MDIRINPDLVGMISDSNGNTIPELVDLLRRSTQPTPDHQRFERLVPEAEYIGEGAEGVVYRVGKFAVKQYRHPDDPEFVSNSFAVEQFDRMQVVDHVLPKATLLLKEYLGDIEIIQPKPLLAITSVDRGHDWQNVLVMEHVDLYKPQGRDLDAIIEMVSLISDRMEDPRTALLAALATATLCKEVRSALWSDRGLSCYPGDNCYPYIDSMHLMQKTPQEIAELSEGELQLIAEDIMNVWPIVDSEGNLSKLCFIDA